MLQRITGVAAHKKIAALRHGVIMDKLLLPS